MGYELNCPAPEGATITVIPILTGVAQAPIALAYIGSNLHSGNMAGAPGVYQLVFLLDGVFYTVSEIDWDGEAEVRVATPAAIAEAVMRYTR